MKNLGPRLREDDELLSLSYEKLSSNVWLVLAVVLPIFLFSVITAMRSFELSGDNDKRIAKKAVSTKLPGHPHGKINNID